MRCSWLSYLTLLNKKRHVIKFFGVDLLSYVKKHTTAAYCRLNSLEILQTVSWQSCIRPAERWAAAEGRPTILAARFWR
jgi:hypothetical protein